MSRNKFAKIIKAASQQNITSVVKPAAAQTEEILDKYPVTECFTVIRNMYVEPKYTKLYVTPEAWIKLMCFIHLIGAYEISGFGRLQEDEEGKTLVTDFDILKQEVRGAYVEASEDAVMDFIRRTPKEQRGQWTLDWHSHVEMGTTPSSTDWGNYKEMLAARMNAQFPFMIVNKRQEVTSHCYISESRHPQIDMVLLQGSVSEDRMFEIYEQCKAKVETLCTKYVSKPVTTTTYNTGYSRFWDKSSNYKNSRVGYGTTPYDYDYYNEYYGDYDDYEDEEVIAAKKAGYVFDEDKNYDDGAVDLCAECGEPLDMNDADERAWGYCSKCLGKTTK